jgi:protein dithiol oxidoreductase (disulfide-forming)
MIKRREFSLVSTAAVVAGLGHVTLAQAQANAFSAGVDYRRLDKPVAVDAPAGKVEVIEFFWYSCPHCNAFEPTLDAWIKQAPKDVVIKRVPVGFRPDFAPQQRLFFAIEAMGLIEKLHAKVFQAIHVERQRLDTPEAIADWVAKQGVDKAKFMEQFNSFSVASKQKRAVQLQDAYRVEGVPALGVAGRFYIDGTLAKGMERALKVAEHLIDEVRKGR